MCGRLKVGVSTSRYIILWCILKKVSPIRFQSLLRILVNEMKTVTLRPYQDCKITFLIKNN